MDLMLGEQYEVVSPENIIRFHVKAHSNRPEDIEVKNHLAQKTICLYGSRWNGCCNKQELKGMLSKDQKNLEAMVRNTLKEKGVAEDVKVLLEKSTFPARFYGGKFFPPGKYEALYIIIGDGNGENWWCVLFPPLCFNVIPEVPDEEETSFSTEEKKEMAKQKTDKDSSKEPSYRFFLLEFLLKAVQRFN